VRLVDLERIIIFPEAYIGGADKLFDAAGQLTSESTRTFLRDFMSKFAVWIETNSKV
jgi:chromate reductase, NAD(P)H dehydrogenase (quinone)